MIATTLEAYQGLSGEKKQPSKCLSRCIFFVSSANINTRLLKQMTSGKSLTYKRKKGWS